MKRIHVWVEFTDNAYRAYQCEAKRQSVKVEQLVEKMLDILLREAEQKAKEGTDHPILIC